MVIKRWKEKDAQSLWHKASKEPVSKEIAKDMEVAAGELHVVSTHLRQSTGLNLGHPVKGIGDSAM